VVATLTFTVTGNEPIRCSTLSSSEGVDFRFTRISRINSIVQTTEDVCTISVQSTAEPGDTNPRESSLAAASTFSITDTAGNTQTVLSGSPQTIWVQRIARPVISLSATTETANQNVAMNGYTVTSSGGTVASYSLTGTLPAGLSFSTTTGRITGTPTVTQTATTYTITATNISGSGTATFTLSVVVPTCANGFGVCVVGNTGPGGGIVFYVQADGGTFTSTGSACNTSCKYLEAAPSDQSTGVVWATRVQACFHATVPGLDFCNSQSIYPQPEANQATSRTAATSIGMGMANTNQIYSRLTTVGLVSESNYTAGIAWAYTNNGKTDWYLPSKDELNQMCKWQRGVDWTSDATVCTGGALNSVRWGASGFANQNYWSSSEVDNAHVWRQLFTDGTQASNNNKDNTFAVRPIRAFG
jgi:hypothetical protein